jgi:sugar lactone lactonase YvrE
MTKLAFVEYTENGAVVPGPPPSVYVIDTDARAVFQVPAAETMYGVAFSADDRFLYLASHERGEIRRVDIAAKRVDLTRTGAPSVQHVIVSNDGTRLVGILMATATYVSYDLPDLTGRKTFASPAGLAKLKWCFGEGAATLDGRFFVLPDDPDDAPRTVSVFRVHGT